MPTPRLEIAVQDSDGARIAFEGGADQLELCSALGVGGLTPSIGLIRETALIAKDHAGGLNVLIRPREGGYVYSKSEVRVMESDIEQACAVDGVTGVVVGVLTASGEVDVVAMRRLIIAAAGREVVFHRAIDTASEPSELLEQLIDVGCTRVLTSGGAQRSIDGVRTLKQLVDRAGGRIEIMAGGGVQPEDIPELLATGVGAVHLSARTLKNSTPAGPGGGESQYSVTDPTLVAAAFQAFGDRPR